MRIYIISPIHTPGIVNVQQARLKKLLTHAGHAADVVPYESTWQEFLPLFMSDGSKVEADFMTEFYRLAERCHKEKARLLFDLRRIEGKLPESLWKFFKLAALSSNLVEAYVTRKDESGLYGLFPNGYGDMPAILASDEEVSGYYQRRSATAR